MKFLPPILLLAAVAAVTACVPRREPPPPPPPAPVTPPPEPPAPPPPAGDWRDVPLTPGAWSYRTDGRGSSVASFGSPQQPRFTVQCEAGARRITFSRPGIAGGSSLTVRTSYGARSLPGSPAAGGLSAQLQARDPLLDQMAFSRGRFTIETPGATMLIIPAWPEPARVIEDCRS